MPWDSPCGGCHSDEIGSLNAQDVVLVPGKGTTTLTANARPGRAVADPLVRFSSAAAEDAVTYAAAKLPEAGDLAQGAGDSRPSDLPQVGSGVSGDRGEVYSHAHHGDRHL
jgi:hypothetical protein